mmetsp:Transcript_31979/g.47200  ORF Transcript_31979/g.47200 Transcript_31979/m.47200 type:complete len:80 (-) Transcript_31979:6-245(-)
MVHVLPWHLALGNSYVSTVMNGMNEILVLYCASCGINANRCNTGAVLIIRVGQSMNVVIIQTNIIMCLSRERAIKFSDP